MRERNRFISILVNETLKLARLRSRVTPQDSTREAARFARRSVYFMSVNAMVRPCSRPAIGKLARGAKDKEHAHRCDSTECDCRNRH